MLFITTHTHTHTVQTPAGAHMKPGVTRVKVHGTKQFFLFKENENAIRKMFLCATSWFVCACSPRVFFTSDELSSPRRCGQSCFSFLFSASLPAAAVSLKRCDRTAHTSDKHLVHLVARLHNLRLRRAPTDTFSCFKRSNSQDSMFLCYCEEQTWRLVSTAGTFPAKLKVPSSAEIVVLLRRGFRFAEMRKVCALQLLLSRRRLLPRVISFWKSALCDVTKKQASLMW